MSMGVHTCHLHWPNLFWDFFAKKKSQAILPAPRSVASSLATPLRRRPPRSGRGPPTPPGPGCSDWPSLCATWRSPDWPTPGPSPLPAAGSPQATCGGKERCNQGTLLVSQCRPPPLSYVMLVNQSCTVQVGNGYPLDIVCLNFKRVKTVKTEKPRQTMKFQSMSQNQMEFLFHNDILTQNSNSPWLLPLSSAQSYLTIYTVTT